LSYRKAYVWIPWPLSQLQELPMISCLVPVCTNHGFREPTFGVHRWVMSTHQEELRTANVKLLSRAIAGRSMYNMDKAVPGSCLVLSCLVLSCTR
jgi:hypothetical protein